MSFPDERMQQMNEDLKEEATLILNSQHIDKLSSKERYTFLRNLRTNFSNVVTIPKRR